MGGVAGEDAVPDFFNQAGPIQDFLRERPVGGIVAAQERQPLPGVPDGDPGQQMKVIVDDRVINGHAAQVDNPGTRHPQQQKQAQQTFLVVDNTFYLG